MPRPGKGPRLYLQPARVVNGEIAEAAVWVIRDGPRKRSTGCGESRSREAQEALANYIIEKHKTPRDLNRDPRYVLIADVVRMYSTDVVPKVRRPDEVAARLDRVLSFFGTMTLAHINGNLCRAYAESRSNTAAARRELEDLRAAINHHFREGYCASPTPVTLPPRSAPRSRWLTRSEVARLLWAAWKYREVQNLRGTDRRTLRHIARFILIGIYTGTRAGAVCGAAFAPTEGRGLIDLDRGVFYRRAVGAQETKKRQPPVRIPARLLAHLRRWRRLYPDMDSPVAWNGAAVKRINKGFRRARALAGLGPDVVPHTLRHTCSTWMALAGVPLYEAAGFAGMSAKVFEDVYGHHHPDFQQNAADSFTAARQKPDRNPVNKTGRTWSNDGKIVDISTFRR